MAATAKQYHPPAPPGTICLQVPRHPHPPPLPPPLPRWDNWTAQQLVEEAQRRGLPQARGFSLATGQAVVQLSHAVEVQLDAAFDATVAPTTYPADAPECAASPLMQGTAAPQMLLAAASQQQTLSAATSSDQQPQEEARRAMPLPLDK